VSHPLSPFTLPLSNSSVNTRQSLYPLRRQEKQKKKTTMDPSLVSKVHPYVPLDLHLPDYSPCLLSMSNILVVFAFSSLLIVSLIWVFSGFHSFFSAFQNPQCYFNCVSWQILKLRLGYVYGEVFVTLIGHNFFKIKNPLFETFHFR